MVSPLGETAESTDPWHGRHEGSVRLRSFDLKTTAISVGYSGMHPSNAPNISPLLRQLFVFIKLVRAVLKIGWFRFLPCSPTVAEALLLDDVIIAGQTED